MTIYEITEEKSKNFSRLEIGHKSNRKQAEDLILRDYIVSAASQLNAGAGHPPKQAIAAALNQARNSGAHISKKK